MSKCSSFLEGIAGSLADSGSSNGLGDMNIANGNGDDEDEDGGTTEGCLTEDDDNDETLEQASHSNETNTANAPPASTMGKRFL